MDTFVRFRSAKFPPYEGEQEQINPGLWGRRLAEYFVEKLRCEGIEPGEIIAEDWGYFIPVSVDGLRLAVCCGHQYGDVDEFLCFTDPDRPIFRRWVKKIDATEQLGRLVSVLNQILACDPEISDIQWSDEAQ
jgi:hypothetical protein